MAADASDAESLRKELVMVKEKAKSYINNLSEEKAALDRELQDKTALLAGVKDKTKAYVEKLKAEEAAAVAALEEKVKDRDNRLSRAKEMLQTMLASKDAELVAAKDEAQALRRKLEEGAHRSPKLNGSAGNQTVEVSGAVKEASNDSSTEPPSVREELQRALKTLASVEESKAGVEMRLAEFKKAVRDAEEGLAEAKEERVAALRDRDAALAETETLRESLLVAQEEARTLKETTERKVEEEKRLRLELAAGAERAADEQKATIRSLEEKLKHAHAEARAGATARATAMGDLRHELKAAQVQAEVAASEAASKADAVRTSEDGREKAEEQSANMKEDLARAEAEVARLQEELQAVEATTGALVAEKEREAGDAARGALELAVARAEQADASAEALMAEVVSLNEKLLAAEEVNAAAVAERVAKAGDGKQTDADSEESVVHSSNGRIPQEDRIGAGDANIKGAGDESATPQHAAELMERVAALEVELAETKKTHAEAHATAPVDTETTDVEMDAKETDPAAEVISAGETAALLRVTALEDELAAVKRALHEAEEASAKLSATADDDARVLQEARASLEEARTAATSASDHATILENELAACKLKLHKVEEAAVGEAANAAAAAEKSAAAAAAELETMKEALRAAEIETSKAREGAGNQAEELSARLMGALEEREEGRRREAAGRKEVERIETEMAKAEAELESARGEAKEAEGKVKELEARVVEAEAKVKEADKRAEESEAGAVGVVKSLEDALTKREEDVKRLTEEVTTARKEATLARAELEARGEALRQAKLDLASAVEEASGAGAKASELKSKLDAETAEHGETKMRLQSETAANAGLKAAVLETNESVSKRVDGMRESIERAEAERDACKAQASSSKSQVQALQAQVASLLREHEGSKTEAGLRVGDLQQRLNEAQALLSRERDAFAERKREMQVYAEAMAKEGDTMRSAVQDAQSAATRAEASEAKARSSATQAIQRAQATVLSLQQALDRQKAESELKLSSLEERNETLESETSRLQDLLAQESGQSEEKAQGLEHSLMDKIEEANLHKKKRLAARSEMIALAKTLEAERDGHKAVGHALQYALVPKAIEQATMLEHVVATAERSVHSLSRASGVRLATNLQAAQASLAMLRGRVAGADDPSAALHQRQFSDLSRVALIGGGGSSPKDMTGSVISDRPDSPLGSTISSDQASAGFWQGDGRRSSGRIVNEQSARKDSVYLERVRRLENEMERVTSGLALVSQSVDQLSELVQMQAGLCGGFSVLCCSSRRNGGGSSSRAGGGPAYTTLEMSNRREGPGQVGGVGREGSTGLIR